MTGHRLTPEAARLLAVLRAERHRDRLAPQWIGHHAGVPSRSIRPALAELAERGLIRYRRGVVALVTASPATDPSLSPHECA